MKSGIGALLDAIGNLKKKSAPEMAELLAEMREIGFEVNEGLQRVSRIVRDLGEFASEPHPVVEETSLIVEVERAWKMSLMHAAAISIKPVLEIDFPRTLRLRTVRHQIGQVLLNLFLNAIQAMEGAHGTVHVFARIDEREAVIRVSDTGPGIPPALQERIFDPFFTTKAPGKGTGLGLSVTYGIMRSLGGSIQVQSEGKNGATFELRLPGSG
jgi:two-component system NtrC family sensor kinase